MSALKGTFGVLAAACLLTTSCGGEQATNTSPSSAANASASAVQASATPPTSPAASSSASASPATSHSAADQFKILKSAFVEGSDIGKGWKGGTPKDFKEQENPNAKPIEFCPGRESTYFAAVKNAVGSAGNSYQDDSFSGSITIELKSFSAAQDPTLLRSALISDVESCDDFKVEQSAGDIFYYSNKMEKLSSIKNGGMVGAYSQTIYADKKRKKPVQKNFAVYAVSGRGLLRLDQTTTPGTRKTYKTSDAVDAAEAQLGKLGKALKG